jgi:hypothetical protein
MNSPPQPADWSDLLEMMTDRFGSLSGLALENLGALLATGRDIVGCAETAVMVPDEDGRHLRFLVSVNSRPEISEIVKDLRVPTDQSIVGCVFSTGQLIAVANPEDFYAGVDQKTGITTEIYLATPIVSQEDVLGVLTFVNRPSPVGPASSEKVEQTPFNQEEIEWSMRLADLAASGLRYYHRMCLQNRLLTADLASVAERFADELGPSLFDDEVFAGGDDSPLARAILALERMSESEQQLAADLLDVVSSHAEAEGAPLV